MKHAVVLVLFALLLYFGWYYAEKPIKRLIRKLARRHVVVVAGVVGVVVCLLVLMFYNRAISLL